MRARGVSAPSRQRDVDLVCRRGDGADAQAHLAGVEVGVAVQGEDAVDPDEPVLGHDVLRASGHELLGGLEDETRADTGGHEPVLDRLERERRADERRRVHVMAARVADAVGLRGELEAGLLPIGRASMSARSAMRCDGSGAPRSATSPVPRSRRTPMPACSRRSATSAVVRTSPRPSSGCVCRSRRIETSSAALCSTVRAMASKGSGAERWVTSTGV